MRAAFIISAITVPFLTRSLQLILTKDSTLASKFFDSVSDRYKEKYGKKSAFHHYFFNQRLQKTLQGLDLSDKDVLDIGSGTGDLYDEVISRWPTTRFFATDISGGMLAQSRVPNDHKFVGHGYDNHSAPKVRPDHHARRYDLYG
ncbi:MAG: hypothetical protein IPI91_08955 [Flavobacteriales bacterium]|nr:hypothetical protein [Flavobacteriales bacterium]